MKAESKFYPRIIKKLNQHGMNAFGGLQDVNVLTLKFQVRFHAKEDSSKIGSFSPWRLALWAFQLCSEAVHKSDMDGRNNKNMQSNKRDEYNSARCFNKKDENAGKFRGLHYLRWNKQISFRNTREFLINCLPSWNRCGNVSTDMCSETHTGTVWYICQCTT